MSRVVKFINSLGYCGITLESDTEPAIVAFRNRVAEGCRAEVTSEDAVKGQTNGLKEQAEMQLRGILRTIRCHIESSTQAPVRDDSPVLPRWVEHAVNILSRCQKGRDGRTPCERLHGTRPHQEFVVRCLQRNACVFVLLRLAK